MLRPDDTLDGPCLAPARAHGAGGAAPNPLLPDEWGVVHSNPWFAALAPELAQAIASLAEVRYLRHGQLVFRQHAPAEEWICVVRGALRLTQTDANGRRAIVAFVPPGDWVGDTELSDGETLTHEAHAHGAAKLLCVGRADFQLLCQRYTQLPRALLGLQCARVRTALQQVADLRDLSLEQRTAKQLLSLERVFGVDLLRGSRIALRVSQSDLGELLGASRQRVNNVLKRFERDGAVRLAAGGVRILGHALLRDRAHGRPPRAGGDLDGVQSDKVFR